MASKTSWTGVLVGVVFIAAIGGGGYYAWRRHGAG